MANNQLVPQTRDNLDKFTVVGHVTGTKRDKFYSEGVSSKTGNPWNSLRFGVDIGDNRVIWVELFGMSGNDVYAYKPSDVKGQKGTTKKIPWATHHDIPEGFRLIGTTLVLEDLEDGNEPNTRVETAFDSVNILSNELQDGMLVRASGKLTFNSYKNKDGDTLTSTKYSITYLSNHVTLPQDMSDFKPATWSQKFVVTSIDRPDTGDDRFTVGVTHVGYNAISNSTLYTRNTTLAKSIQKELRKGQFACNCYGDIKVDVSEPDKTEVETTDEWGDENPTVANVVTGTSERYLLMTGCDGANADHETYTEDLVSQYRASLNSNEKAINTFESKPVQKPAPAKDDEWDDWGSENKSSGINADDLPF